jgi:multiple sugar transport system permease protein
MGLWIILVRMAPPIGFVLPLYVIMMKLRLLDTYPAMVLLYLTLTLPLVTWLMSGFFKSVPKELEEAAMIDGCTRVKTLFKITIPIALPGITTCAIFSLILSWNEFLYALIIGGMNTRTAPVMIEGFLTFEGVHWGELASAGLLVIIPILTFAYIFQKGLIKGLTSGAVR